METPLMALKRLEVPYKHMFACDIERHVRNHIAENFSAAKWFDDLLLRDNSSRTTPEVQLYIAGFPCQPFSSAGLKKGFKDKRGTVFFGCADYIDSKRPWTFLLENVGKLINHDGGKTLKKVMQTLKNIGNGAYAVDWKLLNTQDHGVPQSRPRVYIVGIRKDRQRSEISFPEPLPRVSIESFLDPVEHAPTMADLPPGNSKTARSNVERILKKLMVEGKTPLTKTFTIDHGSSAYRCSVMEDAVMCMTKSRAGGHWVTSRGRTMNLDEMLRCQGMERCFKQVTTDRQLGSMIGNAMSQNVLERLLIKVLPAAGLASGRPLFDRWAAKAQRSTKPRHCIIKIQASRPTKAKRCATLKIIAKPARGLK
jgi:DNA (cytosine-5)-methyltransferase 1